MKKFCLFLLLGIVAFFCTGCVKYSYDIEIDKHDNVTISETEALNGTMLKSFNVNLKDKLKEKMGEAEAEYKSKGYEVKEYDDGTFNGLSLVKKGIEFDKAIEFLPKSFVSENYNNVFFKEKKFLKNIYKIHLYSNINKTMENDSNNDSELSGFDSEQSDSNDSKIVSQEKTVDETTGDVVEKTVYEDGAVITSHYNQKEQEQLSSAMGNFVGKTPELLPIAELTIKVPKKPTKHNATKVINDLEYQWNLVSESQPVEIIIEYEKYDFSTLIIVLVPVLLLLGLIILSNKTKNGDSLNGF